MSTTGDTESDVYTEDYNIASSPSPLLAPVTTTTLSLMAEPAITSTRKLSRDRLEAPAHCIDGADRLPYMHAQSHSQQAEEGSWSYLPSVDSVYCAKRRS